MMKNILCFGDSNTFGYDILKDSRFPWGVRWTSILQEKIFCLPVFYFPPYHLTS